MTDSTPTSPRGTDAPGDHFTVEDAGSTSDPTDLATGSSSGAPTGTARAVGTDGGGGDLAGERTDATSTGTGAQRDGLAALADDDDSIGHVFDQTNGVIERADGDSDGTAESDVRSAAERDDG